MRMSDWKKHREHAEAVSASGFHRGDCPFCGGRNTFTATQETGRLQYNCYKLGCTVGGIFDTDMTASEIMRHMRPAQELDVYDPITMEIPEYVVEPGLEHKKFHRFVKRWALPAYSLMYDVKDERVVFPIHYKGRMIDAVGRAVGDKLPKWYRYTGAADYFVTGSGTTIIVVEDVISAIVATLEVPHCASMAILGTSLSDKHIAKLGEYDRVIVALDPDALQKTIQFRREIESWTGVDTHALKLDDDIKYRVQEDIERIEELCK